MGHGKAKLTPVGRLLLVQRIESDPSASAKAVRIRNGILKGR